MTGTYNPAKPILEDLRGLYLGFDFYVRLKLGHNYPEIPSSVLGYMYIPFEWESISSPKYSTLPPQKISIRHRSSKYTCNIYIYTYVLFIYMYMYIHIHMYIHMSMSVRRTRVDVAEWARLLRGVLGK